MVIPPDKTFYRNKWGTLYYKDEGRQWRVPDDKRMMGAREFKALPEVSQDIIDKIPYQITQYSTGNPLPEPSVTFFEPGQDPVTIMASELLANAAAETTSEKLSGVSGAVVEHMTQTVTVARQTIQEAVLPIAEELGIEVDGFILPEDITARLPPPPMTDVTVADVQHSIDAYEREERYQGIMAFVNEWRGVAMGVAFLFLIHRIL